ncbi:cation-translocating P-type ATPase [Winkia sp. ACRQY]|uniref:HAD ATPase, P-type, family IC n=2 Tax=Bacillati TaxID=1783272 RepID=K0ZJK7_9ACTO|nr:MULTISPECIES: HAD-IC family P-type ATPase [Winkia]PLB81288.1 hypothetical protein CYJ21_03710 [Actinomyces sp. UMB0138]EJZ87975.1 HAD ATPase, P-type, family IC [Winkia neuii BV029A5]MBS5947395.1 HAD-IC family P-type ATPase [Winkia neuii]MCG7301926.1 cation-translocating P-type ATPase [Winkia sp. ACRQY]MDK7162531.1 HAD-IC family P-type ATPase [Winkia sp. UMB3105]
MKGLTSRQAGELAQAGKVNVAHVTTSRPLREIVKANVFTLFNAILAACLVVVVALRSWPDAVFGLVLVTNAATGIFTEWRAKRTLDKVAILNTSPLIVLRDGQETQLRPDQIVLGDWLRLKRGDQIPADGVVEEAQSFACDESILTGESRAQKKKNGDEVLSGGTVTAGSALVSVKAVGDDSYAARLGADVRKFKLATSEIADGINRIIVLIGRAIPIMVLILAWSQIHVAGGWNRALGNGAWRGVVIAVIAGIVGMIPQGLVLLTSVNFATASLKLVKKGVLVQQMPAVEVLARVDTLCLDKTGTLTSGRIELGDIVPLSGGGRPLHAWQDPKDPARAFADSEPEAARALAALVADRVNETAQAIDDALEIGPAEGKLDPFDSGRKWASFTTQGVAWYLGAPEFIATSEQTLQAVEQAAENGTRVLLLVRADGEHSDLAPSGTDWALIACVEQLRPDANRTLQYFRQQGVRSLVISGDNPVTVAAVAAKAGMESPRVGDARDLPSDVGEISEVLENIDVLGRVLPEQKQSIVQALQATGHTVAMTGDGVNDALALKEADLGVAMGSGAPATKAAAKIVLLNGEFSALPPVVAEGRRVLANMERVSSLFLTKTVYATIIAALVSIFTIPYPFLPRHLTLISVFFIGLPAFILAFSPTNQRYRRGFLRRTLSIALPSGVVAAGCVFFAYWWTARGIHAGRADAATVATITLALISATVLALASRPLLTWRGLLVGAMVAAVVGVIAVPDLRFLFSLAFPARQLWEVAAIAGTVGVVLVLVAAKMRSTTLGRQRRRS